MGALFITVLVGIGSLSMAAGANRRFRAQRSLPMQWWLDGRVTWSAPRAVALAFIPVLAILLLGFIAVMSMTVAPRPGQAHLTVPVAMMIGILFLAVQQLHHVLIARTIERGRGW